MISILNNTVYQSAPELIAPALYGQCVFTTFTVRQGSVVGFSEHLRRLSDAVAFFYQAPLSNQTITQNVLAFLEANKPNSEFTVRVSVFPGEFQLQTPKNAGTLQVHVTGRAISDESNPLAVAIEPCVRELPQYKTSNMLGSLRARAMAQDKGFDDALLLRDGLITEGCTWNVFFVVADTAQGSYGVRLVTPSAKQNLLDGVTRRQILDLCQSLGVNCVEQDVTATDIAGFSGAFATSAGMGVRAIGRIDNHRFGPSPLVDELANAYQALMGERL